METICLFTSTYHGLLHRKCVLRCCDNCPNIVIPSQEANKDTTNTYPTICFHVYRNASCFTLHGKRPYEELTECSMCSTVHSNTMNDKGIHPEGASVNRDIYNRIS